jgi:FkbM family methyltransferase
MSKRPDWLNSALACFAGDRAAEAEQICNQVLQSVPGDPDALHLAAVAASLRGDWERTERLARTAIAVNPNRADFYATFGTALYARGDMEASWKTYWEAMHRAPFRRLLPGTLSEILGHAGTSPGPPRFDTHSGQYRSQCFQDVSLDHWAFGGKTGGVFLDVGAHDGITLSNSWFFETVRGWRGLCLEPNPDVYARLAANRKAVALNCGASASAGTLPFLKLSGYSEMLSGFLDTYDPEHRKRIAREMQEQGGSAEVITVETRPLAAVAAEHNISEIDYLSVDTEGSEYAILEAVDFGRLFVHAVTVECNYDSERARMIAMLSGRGFEHVQTLAHDLVFLNRASPVRERFDRAFAT